MAGRVLRLVWLWGPVAFYLALILYLSSLPSIPWAGHTPDWANHGVEYFGLSILLARALNEGLDRPLPGRLAVLTFLLCVLYGTIDELYQSLTPDRFSDWRDVVYDAAGAAAGLLGLRAAGRFLPERDAA
jgi:VanZ family protein